jgi:hypothetical protein
MVDLYFDMHILSREWPPSPCMRSRRLTAPVVSKIQFYWMNIICPPGAETRSTDIIGSVTDGVMHGRKVTINKYAGCLNTVYRGG